MTIYHNRTIPDYYHMNTLIKSQPLHANTQLRNDDILIWYDVIYDEALDHMIQSNGRPGLIVSTAHDVPVLGGCPVQHWPLFLFGLSRRMQEQANNFDDLPVVTCSNFSISKKQINRYLLLKLIEWFRISSFDHTWSGLGATVDLRLLLEDFEHLPVDLIHNFEEFKNHMQTSVTKIPAKFFASPGMKYEGNSHVSNQGDMVWTWNTFLGRIMSQSAVSLIAESIRYESRMVYTEKTIYAVHGLTFPIWIGGYQQAQLWTKKGFDTFDDIINHDYQHCESLLERCTRAFLDNLHILTDLEFAREQKIKNLHRLEKNRDQLGQIFSQECENFWKIAPDQLLVARTDTAY